MAFPSFHNFYVQHTIYVEHLGCDTALSPAFVHTHSSHVHTHIYIYTARKCIASATRPRAHFRY